MEKEIAKQAIITSLKLTINELIKDYNNDKNGNPIDLINNLKPFFRALIELEP